MPEPRRRTRLQWFQLEHEHLEMMPTNVIQLGTIDMILAERKMIPRKKSADDTGDIWQDGW